jgi:hypothetical protein
MSRIKTYELDPLISDKDKVIGTDADNQNQTKNFKLKDLKAYMLSGLEPEVGGNLKITTIVDNDSEETTPEDYFNNLDPALTVLSYEIIFLILNGRTFIFRKNGDTYGIDETQTTASDFTEIDITSVINANLQDLDSVLTQGNSAPTKDAKVRNLYLWDNDTDTEYGAFLDGSEGRVNTYDGEGNYLVGLEADRIFHYSNNFLFDVVVPFITEAHTATYQASSGTIAYLDDIPEVLVSGIVSGDNITVTEGTPGVFTIDGVSQTSFYCTETYLRDSVTNTNYFNNGGYFTYNETTAPIDSIRLVFNQNISFVDETIDVGYIHIWGEGLFNYDSDLANITDNYIDIPFDFEEYFSGVLVNGASFIDITMYPDVIEGENGVVFNGTLPTSISRYIVNSDIWT